MRRRLVLDDFKGAQAGTLIAPAADDAPASWRRGQENRAGSRKIGLWIELVRDADGVAEDGGFRIHGLIDIDAADKLDQLA